MFYAGYISVVGPTLILNMVVASRTICLMRTLKMSQKDNLSVQVLTRRIRSSVILFFVLGLDWTVTFVTLFFSQKPDAVDWIVIVLVAAQGVALLLFQFQSELLIVRHVITRMCPIRCVRERAGILFSTSSSSSYPPRPPARRPSLYTSSVQLCLFARLALDCVFSIYQPAIP